LTQKRTLFPAAAKGFWVESPTTIDESARSLACFLNDAAIGCRQFKRQPGEQYSMSKISAFLKDESGATAIEYGLIAAGISVVIIAAVNAIGSSLNAKFTYISNQLK
jgi:pilus assembly protein Flp/PilA